jgi:hypothetical protein
MRRKIRTVALLNLLHALAVIGCSVYTPVLRLVGIELISSVILSLKPLRHED